MNRVIKFRAWNGNRMVFMGKGGYCDFELSGGYVYEPLDYETLKRDWPLMQFTGLKDKNGVEIYESDIIQHVDSIDDEKLGKYKIIMDALGHSETMGFHAVDSDGELYDYYGGLPMYGCLVVIGNIYENPELLENNND